MLYVGVMSGTSCDGVDTVVVDFSDGIEIKAAQFSAYPPLLKKQINHMIADVSQPVSEVSQLDAELGFFYGQAINRLIKEIGYSKDEFKAIGLHGQTVCHQPPNGVNSFHNTLQIGSAAITAQLTGIDTIANFRQMDMAFGGQGAPLAPVLHRYLFSQPNKHVVVLNLGGIANITSINDDSVLGFDTGPANCLLDEWISHKHGHKYDDSGYWASIGNVNNELLEKLLSEPYFQQKPPKSTGRELFNFNWLEPQLNDIDAVDVQRTLLQLTVESINAGLKSLSKEVDQLVVCGGGVHNAFLMNELRNKTAIECTSSHEFGVDPDYVEALLMAWLAKQHIDDVQLDLRKITGTSQPLKYGVVYKV